MSPPTVFLGSILLEPNRWKPGRLPTIQVSEWSDRAIAAGFAGWELWENHYLKASAIERDNLGKGACPVSILNSYARFDAGGTMDQAKTLAALQDLPQVTAMKFNIGNDLRDLAQYQQGIDSVAARLPSRVRLFCECHAGTLLEDPAFFRTFAAAWPSCPFQVIIHPFLLGPEGIDTWFDAAGPLIAHAHVQIRDLNSPATFLPLAADRPRATACLDALLANHYKGTFTLEFSAPTGVIHETPECLFSAAQQDLDFLREHWPG